MNGRFGQAGRKRQGAGKLSNIEEKRDDSLNGLDIGAPLT